MNTIEETAARLRALAAQVSEETQGEAVARLMELVSREDEPETLRSALAVVGARELLLACEEEPS